MEIENHPVIEELTRGNALPDSPRYTGESYAVVREEETPGHYGIEIEKIRETFPTFPEAIAALKTAIIFAGIRGTYETQSLTLLSVTVDGNGFREWQWNGYR